MEVTSEKRGLNVYSRQTQSNQIRQAVGDGNFETSRLA